MSRAPQSMIIPENTENLTSSDCSRNHEKLPFPSGTERSRQDNDEMKNSPGKSPLLIEDCVTLSPSPKRNNNTELTCRIRNCLGWNSPAKQPPPVAPTVRQDDLGGGPDSNYPESMQYLCYNWEKIMEERKLKAELEEQEKGKRLKIISVKKKSWELLRLCKEIIGSLWIETLQLKKLVDSAIVSLGLGLNFST